jgi:osmotically-inducible protein OsmY
MKTDSQLRTDVAHELAWDTRIDETAIGVCVHHGVVTLTGTVDSWADKHAAEEAAHRVAGVLDVANEIQIVPSWSATRSDADIAEAVRGALTWNRFVPDQQIRSTVADQGTVTLTGTARTLAQRDEAERIVRELAGVRCVSNQIAVESRPSASRSRSTATPSCYRASSRRGASAAPCSAPPRERQACAGSTTGCGSRGSAGACPATFLAARR